VFHISDVFPFCYFCICNELSWDWDPSLNTIHGSKVILYNITNDFVQETKFVCTEPSFLWYLPPEARCGIFHCWGLNSVLVLRRFQIFEVFRLGMPNL
jgi:hypothetical protein